MDKQLTGSEKMAYWRKAYRNPRLMPWQISSRDGMTWWRKVTAYVLYRIGCYLTGEKD